MGPTLLFSQFQILLSHLWKFKKKRRRRKRDKKGEKGRGNQKRKKEKEEEGVKGKKFKKINNYLKKKSLLWLHTGQASSLVLAAAG